MKTLSSSTNILTSLILALTFSTLMTIGCASSRGFNRGALRESADQRPVTTDAEIAQALKLKAQLPKPFKIAIYLAEPASNHRESAGWRWTEEEKTKMVKLADQLKANGEVSQAFILTPDSIHGTSLRDLRLAAARHGADALLTISGIKDIDSYTNSWAWTYVAVVPMLFVPGSQSDVLFMARASLWDVRNEFLYLSAEGESVQRQKAPAAFIEDRDLIEKAKTEAVAKLSDEITNQIKSLPTGETKNGKPAKRAKL